MSEAPGRYDAFPSQPPMDKGQPQKVSEPIPTASPGFQNARGFVAGIFSGLAKLTVGHPFDMVKVRLQTTDKSQFRGPVDCLLQTVRKEGFGGLYKGATPPLMGWMVMDSL